MITLLCALYGLGHGGAKAQVFVDLDVNNVNATFNNTGSLFWDQNSTAQFEVPIGSGKTSIFASALWIGGVNQVTGNLSLSAARFNSNGKDFNPGSITDDVFMAAEQAQYDRIFKITCYEIEQFRNYIACVQNPACDPDPSYTIPLDILEWPAHGEVSKGQAANLAAFVDVNGNAVYEPMEGDYPYMPAGDVMLYFILNDKTQGETGGDPLLLDIHVTAYAYEMSGNTAIDNTVFVNYRLVNRSENTFLNSYMGVWTDFDLGNAQDDYLGCAPMQNMYFAYNSDAFDQNQGGALGYGDLLPAQGVVFLGGPQLDANGEDDLHEDLPQPNNIIGLGDGIIDNERLGMTRFMYHHNSSSATGDPDTDADCYNFMRGIWKDGNAMVYGGTGYPTGCNAPFSCVSAHYMFPGEEDPLGIGTGGVPQDEIWNETTGGNSGGDRRGVGASGPFTFAPGATQHLDIAYVFARLNVSTTNPYDAVDLLKQHVNNLPAINNLPDCMDDFASVVHNRKNDEDDIHVFPNPSTGDQITVNSTKNERLDVLNVLGETLFSTTLNKGQNQVSLSGLAKGLYFLRSGAQSIAFVKE